MWTAILWFFVSNFCCPSVNGEGIMCEVTTNEKCTTEIKIQIPEELVGNKVSFNLFYGNESTAVRVAVLNRVTTGYECESNLGYKCQKLNNYTFSFTSPCAPKGEYNISNDEDQPTMCTIKDHTENIQSHKSNTDIQKQNKTSFQEDTSERQPHDAKTSESNPNTNIDREAGSDEKNTIILAVNLGIDIGFGIAVLAVPVIVLAWIILT